MLTVDIFNKIHDDLLVKSLDHDINEDIKSGDPVYRIGWGSYVTQEEFESSFRDELEQTRFMLVLNGWPITEDALAELNKLTLERANEVLTILIEQPDAECYYTEAG